MLQHLYETAAMWGDKILSWTGELTASHLSFKEDKEARGDASAPSYWMSDDQALGRITEALSLRSRLIRQATRTTPSGSPKPTSSRDTISAPNAS